MKVLDTGAITDSMDKRVKNELIGISKEALEPIVHISAKGLTLVALMIASLCFGDQNPDHLVPLREYYGNAPLYREFWRQKLLVTSGDVARYVHLPGASGVEDAVSVYVDKSRKGGLPGGYWITSTQPQSTLADYITEEGLSANAGKVRIRRWDSPMRASTALKVHEVWVLMISGVKPDECEGCVTTDSTTEIFSTQNSSGVEIVGQLPIGPGPQTIAFVKLAGLLIDYTRVPSSKRDDLADEIDKGASALLRQLMH